MESNRQIFDKFLTPRTMVGHSLAGGRLAPRLIQAALMLRYNKRTVG